MLFLSVHIFILVALLIAHIKLEEKILYMDSTPLLIASTLNTISVIVVITMLHLIVFRHRKKDSYGILGYSLFLLSHVVETSITIIPYATLLAVSEILRDAGLLSIALGLKRRGR